MLSIGIKDSHQEKCDYNDSDNMLHLRFHDLLDASYKSNIRSAGLTHTRVDISLLHKHSLWLSIRYHGKEVDLYNESLRD